MELFDFISKDVVHEMIRWDGLFQAMEAVMKAYSDLKTIQRVASHVTLGKSVLMVKSAYLSNNHYDLLGCKTNLVKHRSFKKGSEKLLGNIFLFDEKTGQILAICEESAIKALTTTAVSAVATNYIFKPEQRQLTLAVISTEEDVLSHAEGFAHYFNWEEIRLMSKSKKKTKAFAKELNRKFNMIDFFKVCKSAKECVTNADIIIVTSDAKKLVLKSSWLKESVHINYACSKCNTFCKLEEEIYANADIYLDSWENAKSYAPNLLTRGYNIMGEVGNVIHGHIRSARNRRTIFKFFGMAIEDIAATKVLYDQYFKNRHCPL